MSRPQPRDQQRTCTECGFVSKTTTTRLADNALRLHSCDRWKKLAASKQRAEQIEKRIDRTPKPCLHKEANHQHGNYSTYVLDRCRCLPCVAASTAWKRNQVRKSAQGRWQPYVDATPVRAHVRSLMDQGMGWKRIADAAGISSSVVCSLIYGKGRRQPSAQVRPATAEALLAVDLDLAPGALIDATGTWRRLHSLVAIGYPKSYLAHRLGFAGPGLQLRTIQVEAATAARVHQLYLELRDTPGHSTRARNDAIRNGYLSPLWWDDDTIDNPTHQPVTVDAPRHWSDIDDVAVDLACQGHDVGRPLTRAERVTAVLRLLDHGVSQLAIADRLGLQPRQVNRDVADYGQKASA